MRWTIDPSHSSASFAIRHLGLATVRGRFAHISGEAEFDAERPADAKGRVEIETASVETGDERRDEHLRSGDFFDAEKYPTMVFESSSIEQVDDQHFRIRGDFTIRDVTKPIELEGDLNGVAQDPWGNTRVGGSVTGVVNRNDFGLKWNQVLEAGRLLVGDQVRIDVDVEMVAQKEAEEVQREAEEETEIIGRGEVAKEGRGEAAKERAEQKQS